MMRHTCHVLVLCLTLTPLQLATADPLDAPAGYYDAATGTGALLKAQLNEIIDQHNSVSYSNRETGIEFLDEDPGNSLNVIEVYSGFSVAKSQFPAGAANTEHLWPNSYGIDDTNPAYGDFFNLRPCDMSVNSSRGNKYYDNVGGSTPAHPQAPECRTDSTRWEPRPIEKGDLARSMFYLDTRYEGDANDVFARNLQLTDAVATITTSNNNFGKLSTLVQWHFEDSVAPEERLRNHRIYSGCGYVSPASCQHNRNPFIDRPEFVWAVFGASPNDSTLYFGDTIPADGASPLGIELPTLIIGAPASPATNLLLKKSGSTPTTFEINISGEFNCAPAGPRMTFVSGVQTRDLIVTASNVNSVGLHSGTITINNTDLTSAGDGQGVADGDDVIGMTQSLLDHAAPSFDADAEQLALTVDFGEIPEGSGEHVLPFSVFNRDVASGFTAGVELVSVSGSGDTLKLTTDFSPISSLAAGQSALFQATLDATSEGEFTATYVITTHDENLPGAIILPDLVLTLNAYVTSAIPCLAADANCDAVIDELDVAPFVDLLLGNITTCSSCAADMNDDLLLNGDDIEQFTQTIRNP